VLVSSLTLDLDLLHNLSPLLLFVEIKFRAKRLRDAAFASFIIGNEWTAIAKALPGRTASAVRNRRNLLRCKRGAAQHGSCAKKTVQWNVTKARVTSGRLSNQVQPVLRCDSFFFVHILFAALSCTHPHVQNSVITSRSKSAAPEANKRWTSNETAASSYRKNL
jgi:hypothetical protein